MTLSFARDGSPAAWLADADVPWTRLVTFGPGGFEAYGRLRYIPDPVRPPQSENDAPVGEDHPADLDRARHALAVLERFTTTPADCWFCVWDGYDELPFPPALTPRPWVELPHRRYALLRGRPADLDAWETVLGTTFPPAFVWPGDRSWLFVSDVDPHWAGIAATRVALDALVAEPGLDVVEADPLGPQPTFAP